jgi:hypothetical protein
MLQVLVPTCPRWKDLIDAELQKIAPFFLAIGIQVNNFVSNCIIFISLID